MADLQPPLSANRLASGIVDLISLPEVYLQLQRVMDSKHATAEKVAEVLSLDPALVAKLLKIANSALYGFPSPVETVSRAVNILGTQQIHDLVLAAGVTSAFRDLPNELMDMSVFWQRSVQTGILARSLGEGAGLLGGEALFVRGLLHDIGHLVLYRQFPDLCRQALKDGAKGLCGVIAAERELIGCAGIDVTTEICNSWGLPGSFTETFIHLGKPAQAPHLARETAMLHIAAQITHGMDTDLLLGEVINAIDPEVWQLARLPTDVAGHALDASAIEMMEAMYRLLVAP